jgi:hypothetical protein
MEKFNKKKYNFNKIIKKKLIINNFFFNNIYLLKKKKKKNQLKIISIEIKFIIFKKY